MNYAKLIDAKDRQTLLIVEDEKILLELLADASESLGFHVIQASNGAEALEIMKQKKINLVLSDINMPIYNGMQLLSKCRKLNFHTPFVFLTGNSSIDNIIEAVRLGAMDFLIKPFEMDMLEKVLKRVSAIAERQEYIDELLQSIGKDVAPQTHAELNNLRRQINLLKALAHEEG